MDDLRREIEAAVQLAQVSEDAFHPVPPSEAEHVSRQAENCFVREPGRRWWWEVFRCRGYAVVFRDVQSYQRLTQVVPSPTENVWLIANVDEESAGPVLVYDGSVDSIQTIIGRCYGFEYYLVAHTYEWLICETHHNQIIAQGYKAIKRLKEYAVRHPEEVWRTQPYPTSR